jgi:hypothetical protein
MLSPAVRSGGLLAKQALAAGVVPEPQRGGNQNLTAGEWHNRVLAIDLPIRAESAQLYPAAKRSDWIFYQEKPNFVDV